MSVFNERQMILMAKATKPEIREAFRGTSFVCPCGGEVYPTCHVFGECFACGTVSDLNTLEYETADES